MTMNLLSKVSNRISIVDSSSRVVSTLTRSLVCAFVGFVAASVTGGTALAAKPAKPIVYVQKLESTELSETLTYPARVEPRIKAEVASEADGIVSKIDAPLGTRVKAKTPLLVIRNTDPVYQYAPQVVVSPVAGVVSRVDVTEGSRVARGDKLALVTDPAQVRVVVEIPAQDVRLIHQGQMAELRIPGEMNDGANGGVTALKVRGLSPFVDPATGTASCELELAPISRLAANPKTAKDAKGHKAAVAVLPPAGSIARVTFKANVRNGLSVDEGALTYRGRDPFVRLVREGKAVLVPITLGRKQAGMVEILKGIKAGDQIVQRSSGFISDGEAVTVEKASTDAPPPGDADSDSSED